MAAKVTNIVDVTKKVDKNRGSYKNRVYFGDDFIETSASTQGMYIGCYVIVQNLEPISMAVFSEEEFNEQFELDLY